MVLMQVGDTRRPTLLASAYDGDTVLVATRVDPARTVVVIPMSGPVAQGGGAGLWTATAPYTLNLPGRWWERFVVTNAVSGLGAGAPVAVPIDVEATPPVAAPVPGAWATTADYMRVIGGAPPDNLESLLWRATLALRPHVALGWYDATAASTVEALAQACCLQVAYAQENGWTTGAPQLVQSGQIGSLRVDPPRRNDGGSVSDPLASISPLAGEVLRQEGLLSPVISTDVIWPLA